MIICACVLILALSLANEVKINLCMHMTLISYQQEIPVGLQQCILMQVIKLKDCFILGLCTYMHVNKLTFCYIFIHLNIDCKIIEPTRKNKIPNQNITPSRYGPAIFLTISTLFNLTNKNF